MANFVLDESLAAPAPRSIALLDDVLTTGAHFVAAKSVLASRFPGAFSAGFSSPSGFSRNPQACPKLPPPVRAQEGCFHARYLSFIGLPASEFSHSIHFDVGVLEGGTIMWC